MLRRWICPAPAPDAIAGRLLELAGDRSPAEIELVKDLVTAFLARAPDRVSALCAAGAAGDAEALEDQAHSLRGAAGNIGATAVMEACERLENDARDGQLPDAIADVHTLRRELGRAEVRLRDVLSEHYSEV
jgi:HPt (histidine-containing phosphotransfer) domain-containing protein